MRYLLLFGGQGINFLIAVVNIRAASKGRMLLTGSTDFLFCVVNFLLIQHIAVSGAKLEVLAYATGGMVGSMLAVRLTRNMETKS